jgi:alcohol dehydrogenase (cytochrome c)
MVEVIKKSRSLLVDGIAIGALLFWMQPARRIDAQAPTRNSVPTFTEAQVTQGQAGYSANCATCHGANLDDGEFGPPLTGSAFDDHWGGQAAEAVFTYMRTKMPPAGAGTLPDAVYAQILAYMLRTNGLRPGGTELPPDPQALASMILPEGAGRIRPRNAADQAPTPNVTTPPPTPNPLDKITPVADARLINPPAADWLTWRRTYDDFGFSPLTQINKNNVKDLRVAWSWSLPNGPNEATPLVHDGVLFVHGYRDNVQALAAATGDLLWQYSRKLPPELQTGFGLALLKRNIAIYGNKILLAASDLHVVALDVKTGKVVWDHAIADDKKGRRITGGPLAAKGKVMVGTTSELPGGNFIVGLDMETGDEAWRFRTIAQPGEPGGESWNGVPPERRKGASSWTAGSYDPELNLAYFGIAQTYDTGPLMPPSKLPGVTNDALYTDSTVALNPDTGKLVWYFQHQPNDQWDLDWVFEQQIIPLPVNGVTRKLVVTSGKPAIYDAVDAETGKYAFSIDLGLQNFVTAIDPKTGAKTIDPTKIPNGETVMVCPNAGAGAKSWLPGAYDPNTKMLYTPLMESCMYLIPVGPGERGLMSSGVRWTQLARPDSDGKYGRLEAVNLETKKVAWVDRQRAPRSTGILATAGGVIFAGSTDRVFAGYDEMTGKELWRARLNDPPTSAPITYAVNGKQYVAVIAGNGGPGASSHQALVPEIRNSAGGEATIWVFELPKK